MLFQVVEEGTAVYIVASRKLPKKNGWRHILESQEYSEACEEMGIAHPVGIDAMGNMVISDLTIGFTAIFWIVSSLVSGY